MRNIPPDWFLEDAVRRGDVDLVTHLSRLVSLFYLHQDHPEVYEKLVSMEMRAMENMKRKLGIGQVVGKQENHFMMSDKLMGLLNSM